MIVHYLYHKYRVEYSWAFTSLHCSSYCWVWVSYMYMCGLLHCGEYKADVRHATKLSNFVAQLCWATKLPVWLRNLPNFWRVAQLICRIETISVLRQFLAMSLGCDWSIVCLHVNCWFCCKLLAYYLFYISFNISYFKSKLMYKRMNGRQDTRSHVYLAIVCQWKIDSCLGKFVTR